MAFGQLDFQPSVANSFLMDIALYWFIYGRSPVSGVLNNHQVVGSHTDIYMFYPPGNVTRLIWSHPGIRPFGYQLPIQCECKALKSLSPKVKLNSAKNDVQVIRNMCRNKACGHVIEHFKPPGYQRIGKGNWERSDAGEWYMETVR
jgi:hypothetical protein